MKEGLDQTGVYKPPTNQVMQGNQKKRFVDNAGYMFEQLQTNRVSICKWAKTGGGQLPAERLLFSATPGDSSDFGDAQKKALAVRSVQGRGE